MLKREDLPLRYKNLILIELLPTKSEPLAICRCDCGNVVIRSTRHYADGLWCGHCGCMKNKNSSNDG